jgi:hypothetical protein
MSGFKDHMLDAKTGYQSQNAASEPPCKRQRVESHSKPYVKTEGAGAVSPVFSSTAEEDVVVTKSRSVITPGSKQSQSSKNSTTPALTLEEFHSVEKTMQSSLPKRRLKVVSPHFTPKFSNGSRQPSEDYDPEKFTRESKKARYEERANDLPDFVSEIYEDTQASRKKADRGNTPLVISDIFDSSILPSKEERQNSEEDKLSKNAPMTRSHSELIHGHQKIDVLQGFDSPAHEPQPHQPPAAVRSVASNKPKTRSKRAHPRSGTFHLRRLKYGILPEDESYTAEVSENLLRFYENEALLSKEPICPDIPLSKLFKINHGSDNCLKLILEESHRQGQPYDKIHLELDSIQDKENFLSLMPNLTQGSFMVNRPEYV